MNKIYLLTKVLFKNGLSTFGSGKSTNTKNFLYAGLIVLAFIPFIKEIVDSTVNIFFILEQTGRQNIILAVAEISVSLIIMVFGIFYIINVYYYSADIKYLLPLPLKSFQIVTAKFFVVLMYEFLTEIIFLAPVLITYGILSNAGIIYYLYSFIIFLFLPVVPLIISSLIALFLMSFSFISKNKDRFRIVSGVFVFIIAFSLNFFLKNSLNISSNPQKMLYLLNESQNSLFTYIASIFPPVRYSAEAIAFSGQLSGLVSLLIFVSINIVALFIFLALAEKFYLKGVISLDEVKKVTVSNSEVVFSAGNSIIKEIVFTEFKILLRTPAFFLNCIIINFIWPFVIFFYIGSIPQREFEQLINLLVNDFPMITVLFGIIFGLFAAGTNGLGSSTISRDGQSHFLYKYLPISFKQFLIGKTLPAFIIGLIAVILITTSVTYKSIALLPYFPVFILTSMFGIIFAVFTGFLLDLLFPKLVWDNEYKPVKQNLNVVFNMALSILVIAAICILVFEFKLHQPYQIVGIFLVFIILLLLLYLFLLKKGVKIYNNIH